MEEIIVTYENHASIKLIKDNVLSEDKDFTIEPATVLEINKIIKHVNLKKATEPHKSRVKIVKLAINIITLILLITTCQEIRVPTLLTWLL